MWSVWTRRGKWRLENLHDPVVEKMIMSVHNGGSGVVLFEKFAGTTKSKIFHNTQNKCCTPFSILSSSRKMSYPRMKIILLP